MEQPGALVNGRYNSVCFDKSSELASRLRGLLPRQGRVDVRIGTDFEVRVWEKLLDIPMGHLTTYSDLAARAGSPKAARGSSRNRTSSVSRTGSSMVPEVS